MKKILAIVTMAAMVAGAFAVDVAAKAKMELHVAAYNKDEVSGFGALALDHGSEGWNPSLAFNAGGDEAGAGFKIYDTAFNSGSEFTMASAGWNIWFKPLDSLTVKLGEQDFCLNQEHIEWDHSNSKIGSWQAVGFSFNSNGIGIDAMLDVGNYGMSQKNDGSTTASYWFKDSSIAQTAIKFSYAADFGTIAADYWYQSGLQTIGLGYAGNAAGWSFFVNALVCLDDNGFLRVHPEFYIDGKAGDIGIQLFVPFTYNTASVGYWNYRPGCQGAEGAHVGTTAKISFPAGSLNGYVELKVADWLNDLSVNVIPALTGAVGSMGWEAKFDASITPDAANVFTFDVPVIFTLNF